MKKTCRLLAAGLLAAAAASAPAGSLTASGSSASSAGSASVGSLSDSLKGSSDSSTRREALADGDYRIAEVQALPERPGMARLTLRARAADTAQDTWLLEVPQRALGTLAAGDFISARHRPYGVELARADTQEPFFLLLADDWQQELAPRAVTL